jgi:hypothetical protein
MIGFMAQCERASERASGESDDMPKNPQETTLQENLARQLCDSVDSLQKQVEKVEFWASAVQGLTAPIPEYHPDDAAIARYVKPGRLPKKASSAHRPPKQGGRR